MPQLRHDGHWALGARSVPVSLSCYDDGWAHLEPYTTQQQPDDPCAPLSYKRPTARAGWRVARRLCIFSSGYGLTANNRSGGA
jgi:hypothetical protein